MSYTTVLIVTAALATLIAILSLLRHDARIMSLLRPELHRPGHFSLYAALGFFCVLALEVPNIIPFLRVLAGFFVATLFGAILEYLQRYRPGRSSNRRDALTNAAGAALGVAAAFLVIGPA